MGGGSAAKERIAMIETIVILVLVMIDEITCHD